MSFLGIETEAPPSEDQIIKKNFRLMISDYQGGLGYIKRARKKYAIRNVRKITDDKGYEFYYFKCNTDTGEVEEFYLDKQEGEGIGCYVEERDFNGTINFQLYVPVGKGTTLRVLNHTGVLYKSWLRERAERQQAAAERKQAA